MSLDVLSSQLPRAASAFCTFFFFHFCCLIHARRWIISEAITLTRVHFDWDLKGLKSLPRVLTPCLRLICPLFAACVVFSVPPVTVFLAWTAECRAQGCEHLGGLSPFQGLTIVTITTYENNLPNLSWALPILNEDIICASPVAQTTDQSCVYTVFYFSPRFGVALSARTQRLIVLLIFNNFNIFYSLEIVLRKKKKSRAFFFCFWLYRSLLENDFSHRPVNNKSTYCSEQMFVVESVNRCC